MKNKHNIHALVESAVMTALSTVLSFIVIPFLTLPYGGNVTFCSMLPLIIIGYRYGAGWGLASSAVYGFIQIMLGMSTISAAFLPGADQMVLYKAILMVLLDYFLAYSVIGVSGAVTDKLKKKLSFRPSKALCIGAVTGCTLRYAMHFISGIILWGSYAKWFFADQMQGRFSEWVLGCFSGFGLSVVYSAVYNGLYMIPETIITALAAYFIGKIPQISRKKP